MKNPVPRLVIEAKIGSADVSRNLKAVLTTILVVLPFYPPSKSSALGKFV